MNKRWTDTERDFLKRHYNDMSTEDIALKLDKTVEQIHSQVYYLRKRGWTFNRRKDAVS
jgi:DNA-directed RNA polymerase specialized sigma24 family protein